MKKIYVLLMHTNTMPAKLIKMATNYPYSHVGISLEKDCNTIYSFGRKKFNSVLQAGFSIESKHGKFFQKFNKTICKIYEIEITDNQYEDLERIIADIIINRNHYKYDFIGIVLRFFGIPVTFKNRYVCSYFVASLLEKAKIYHFKKRVSMVKPQDFEGLLGFQKIYAGRYALYH